VHDRDIGRTEDLAQRRFDVLAFTHHCNVVDSAWMKTGPVSDHTDRVANGEYEISVIDSPAAAARRQHRNGSQPAASNGASALPDSSCDRVRMAASLTGLIAWIMNSLMTRPYGGTEAITGGNQTWR